MVNAPQRVLQVVISEGGTLVEHLQVVVTMHVRDVVDEVWRIAAVFMRQSRARVCTLTIYCHRNKLQTTVHYSMGDRDEYGTVATSLPSPIGATGEPPRYPASSD